MLYALEGKMQKSKFLNLLTGALALGNATAVQTTALDAWTDKWLEKLTAEAVGLFTGPFAYQELGMLAETCVIAAQELKGVIKGIPRAVLAQKALGAAARAALPDAYEGWALMLIDGPGAAILIESAFQRLFGPEGTLSNAPVVDAPEVAEGGIQ